MHDGRFKTIDQVIDFYSEGVIMSPYTNPLMHQAINGGVQLTPIEKLQLKAFLNTLTDMDFVTDVRYSKPTDLK